MNKFFFQTGERELLLRLRTLLDSGKRNQTKQVLIERTDDEYKLSSLTPHGQIQAKKPHR